MERVKTQRDVVAEIIRLARENPDRTPVDIRKELLRYRKEILVPKERAIYGILKKNADKLKTTPLDLPWSLGACDYIHIPSERISEIIEIAKLLPEGRFLTVRRAKWISRLSPLLSPVLEKHYHGEVLQNMVRLYQISSFYSREEQLAEIDGRAFANTTTLDRLFIIEGKVDTDSIVDMWFTTYLSPKTERVKEKTTTTPTPSRLVLGKVSLKQSKLLEQWVTWLIASERDSAKTFLKKHPDIELLALQWLAFSLRREIPKASEKDGEVK